MNVKRTALVTLGIAALLASCGAAPTATAAPGTPTLLRNDLKIRKLTEVGPSMMRLDIDPATHILTYLDSGGNVYELDKTTSKSNRVYSHREIGGADYTEGMVFGPDRTLYVIGNESDGVRGRCVIRKVLREGVARQWITLAQTDWYPKSATQYDHNCTGMAVSPDNKWLYFSSGSRSDHGEVQDARGQFKNAREVPLTSAVFRVPTATKDVAVPIVLPNDEAKLKAGGYLFADGTRNAFDMAFNANGDLIAIDNSPDMDANDEINWLREGRHYGFPWRFGSTDNPQQVAGFDAAKDGRLSRDFLAVKDGSYRNDPTFPKPPSPITFTDPIANTGPDADQFVEISGAVKDASDLKQSLAGVTAHRSPLGLVFDNGNALGGDYTGAAFVVSWGAAGGPQTDRGQDLLMLKLTKKGDAYSMTATQIAKGFSNPMDAVLDGKMLYVLDFGGRGAIWEITFP